MRMVIKILKWSSIAIIMILIGLFGLSFFLQDKVVAFFINSLNKNLSTKIETGAGKFSLINKFPRASVRLKDVLVHSSPRFDNSQFKNLSTDTLLYAESVSLEFRMIDLIKGNYNIESITGTGGILNLLSDSSGMVNYEIAEETTPSNGEDFVINLERILLKDIRARYINVATSLDITGTIKSGKLKSRIAGDNIDFTASAGLQLTLLDAFPLALKTPIPASLFINMHQSDSGIFISNGTLKTENFSLGISGMIYENNLLDLKISGRNIELSRIKKFLPPAYAARFTEYNPSGNLKVDCTIHGFVDRKNNPDIEINYSLGKGQVHYKKSDIELKDLSFSGSFTNGRLKSPESAVFKIDRFDASLGSAMYSGSLIVENYLHPKIDLIFSGEIIPAEVTEFLDLKEVSWAEGAVRVNLKLSGNIKLKDKYSLNDFIDLNPEADLHFSSMGIAFNKNKFVLKDIDGNIMFARNLWAEGLSLSYMGQRFKIEGEFTNLPAWLAGQPVFIKVDAAVSAGNFEPEVFMADSSSSSSLQRTAFRLPEGLQLNLKINIDNLKYRKFSAGNITGSLTYKPGILSFNSLSVNSMDGFISGDCLLAVESGKSFITRSNLTFEDIDINKAFVSFNNFSQDFLKAENIKGSLSGKLSLLMPMDSMLHPVIKAITAEGNYVISDGELINFEPVKSLSGFIDVSELENIKFSKLENDFFIRDNYFATPQMDIRSTASDFSVNGKHGFDNVFEYHVRMYLSELLSKKAKKGRNYSTEFGAVEDDGLGRTSVFLKITGKDDEIKVGYDLKAASGNVKQNLKSEKETMKNIFNKQYGWFKKDSSVRQETAPKPRFRIEWGETDSTKTLPDSSSGTREKPINRIFKKKKGINSSPIMK
jgi:hypothetical protein